MESVAARYDDQARDAGVYIVSACGFDCIPNDLGALLLQKSFNGDLAYMESYMSVTSGVRERGEGEKGGAWGGRSKQGVVLSCE